MHYWLSVSFSIVDSEGRMAMRMTAMLGAD